MKTILMCILSVAVLSACGIKPSRVKPPEGSRDVYPRSYPQPPADESR